MKNIAGLAMATASALMLTSCQTAQYSLTPSTTNSGNVTYYQGVATVASDKTNGAVKVTSLGFTPHGRIRIAVAAINKSNNPANLGYENVAVIDGNGVTLHKLDRDELVKIARQQAAIADFAIALGGAAQSYSNSLASQTTTYGHVGQTRFSATTYNPALANALNEQTAADTAASMRDVNARLSAVVGSLNGSILQTTTIQPGGAFGGEVIVDRPKLAGSQPTPQKVSVTVTFAGEEHIFSFDITNR